MTDKIRESLSALMDGEASEIEVHRLLREIEQNPELRLRWLSYQQIRSVIRREPYITGHAHAELAERLRASIAVEDSYDEEFLPVHGGRRASWIRPAAGIAAAASLVAVIFMAVQTTQVADDGEPGAARSLAETQATSEAAVPSPHRLVDDATLVSTSPVNNGGTEVGAAQEAVLPDAVVNEDQGGQQELRELDAERLRQVRAYLMRHDRVARMNPYARVVTNPQGPGN